MRGLYLHRRFFILLLIGVFASVMAFIFPFLYAWVIWFLFVFGGLVVADMMLLYTWGKAIDAQRTLTDRLSNGEDNPVLIRVESRYPFRVRVRVLDEIPAELQKRDLELRFSLAAGSEAEQTYFLHPVTRGEYAFGRLRIFVSSALSLVERRFSCCEPRKVAVYPSFVAMHKYEIMAFAGMQTGTALKKVRVAAITSSFDQIKPYTQGDDSRAVNWKATAKCNRLMVNAYMEEKSQPVYCVVDKGRTMQAPFLGMTSLDYAINATLALSNVILKKGDKAGLLTFSNKPGTLIRADNRRLQLNHISEALYNQQTHYLESDFEHLYVMASRSLHTRGLFILFTNFDTVSGMKRHMTALKKLARNHLVLLILFENTEINRVVSEKAGNIKDIYFKTIAGSFISEKRRIAAELRKAGIYTLLTEPGELTVNAINGYLELKERGVI